MAADRKLDIFRVLAAADVKDRSFYENLTEDEVKALAPFIVARWMSGTPSAGQVYFINELFNPFVFSLGNHKQLLWYLLTVCSSGKKQRYSWNALPGKKSTSKPNAVRVVKEYFKYSTADAVNALVMLSGTDILDMAEELGWQPDEIAKLKKELKTMTTPERINVPDVSPNSLLDF